VFFQRRLVFGVMVFAATIVAGCAGSSTSNPTPAVQPSATASPNQSGVQFIAIPGTAGIVSLPGLSGITPGFGIGAGAPAGLTMNASEGFSAPANAPAPSSVARKTAATTTGITPFLFVTATFSAAVPAGLIASEVVSFASNLTTTGLNFFCELDDITTSTASKIATFGPATTVNGTVTISNTVGGGSVPALVTGHTYLFQYYDLPIPGPTPSPSPSPAPTATPSGGATPSPSPSPTAAPTTTPTAAPTAAPTGPATPVPAFTFSGPNTTSASVTPPTVPAALVLPAVASPGYSTYSAHVSIQFGAATSSGAYTMRAALGSTAADISPAGSFPFYTGSAATPLFYVLLTPNVPVTFSQTPSVMVNVASFGSSNTCSLFIYGNTGGSTFSWLQVPGTLVNVSGTSVTIPAVAPPAGLTLNFLPTQTQLAFVGC
jgi:hypothetical protein